MTETTKEKKSVNSIVNDSERWSNFTDIMP